MKDSTNTGLIGVIVPVYKTEEYIAECIESILAQTYTNFRLILVDDGSPDGAGAICDEYAAKDKRITVIHQKNAGVTRARARGMEEASDCEWITFVDSDDTITSDAIKTFQERTNDDTDIIIQRNNTNSGESCNITTYRSTLISGSSCNNAPWGILFRKSIFNDEIFNIPRDIVVGEDMLMNIRLSFCTHKNIAYIDTSVYNYRTTQTGITKTFTGSPIYEYKFQRELIKSIPEGDLEEYYKYTVINQLRSFQRFWGYKYNVDDMKDSPFYQELRNDIEKQNYKLSFIEKIIFYCTNPIMRFFAINTKKIINIINTLR